MPLLLVLGSSTRRRRRRQRAAFTRYASAASVGFLCSTAPPRGRARCRRNFSRHRDSLWCSCHGRGCLPTPLLAGQSSHQLAHLPLPLPCTHSSELLLHPLRSLVGTAAAAAVLTTALNLLALRFGVNSWQDGLCMAGALLLIDICLNARCAWVGSSSVGISTVRQDGESGDARSMLQHRWQLCCQSRAPSTLPPLVWAPLLLSGKTLLHLLPALALPLARPPTSRRRHPPAPAHVSGTTFSSVGPQASSSCTAATKRSCWSPPAACSACLGGCPPKGRAAAAAVWPQAAAGLCAMTSDLPRACDPQTHDGELQENRNGRRALSRRLDCDSWGRIPGVAATAVGGKVIQQQSEGN